jgi:hypothetical protein
MDIAAIFRGDRCRLVSGQSSRNPGNSSTIAWDKKKNRGSDPFLGRNARENAGSRHSKPAKDAPISGQNDGKWESGSRVPLPRSGSGWGMGGGDSGGAVPGWAEVNSTSTNFGDAYPVAYSWCRRC